MTPYTVKARINSLRGKLEEVTIVDMFEENNQTIYIAEYEGKRCRTLFNWFVCTYYVDDIYGVINESKAQ